jgi:hypothetical protein
LAIPEFLTSVLTTLRRKKKFMHYTNIAFSHNLHKVLTVIPTHLPQVVLAVVFSVLELEEVFSGI